MVGVHSPEFEHERPRASVEAAVKRHGLTFPQLLDSDMAYWKALGNEYWPTAYLVDRCGRIRERHIGEVHDDDESGIEMKAKIETLLAESATGC